MIDKLIAETDFSKVFTDILKLANDLIGEQTFYISFMDEERLQLMKTLVKSDIHIQDGMIVLTKDTYCQKVYKNRLPVIIEDAAKDERTKHLDSTYEMNIGSYAGVPIVLKDGTFFGTLCSLNSCIDEYDQQTVNTLERLASLLSYSIYMEKLLISDPLTGLYNRIYWNRVLTSKWIQQGVHSFLMMDLDKFKEINDKFGHEAGDSVLQQIASIVKEIVPEHSYGFRFGGDEFGVLLPNIPVTKAHPFAEMIVKKSAEYQNDMVNGILLSAGLVDTASVQALKMMPEADRLLYKSKRKGGSQISFFEK
ncbi:hypothetical protein BTO30_03445 [Domibacillus antri]|uniref:GGDEF domain-containing protein n=1 Tax=Domibacillus antri TaxID=1714264 RepID=A0A1Q8Q8M4_9BACI|nr:sensor domain-containing diguanylate cyclase [Domibacillus antri]OLN23635.1 hypothetical protein BTO30_03445 [Domibacillus antri]